MAARAADHPTLRETMPRTEAGPRPSNRRRETGDDTLRAVNDDVKAAARTAEDHPALRVLARGGYIATGVVHVIVGVMAIAIAWTGEGESDQAGALTAIARAPLGFLALWALALLLWALGVYHVVHGFALRIDDRKKRWGRRISEWGQGAVFLVMGTIASTIALGARPDADRSAQSASRGLLSFPGGQLVLIAVGLAVAIGGISFIVMGVRRSFRQRMSMPPGKRGRTLSTLGMIGFVGKGVALAILGVLLGIAGIRHDPDAAGGLDAAIETLRQAPSGPALVTAVGAGLIAYGLFCGFRARYASM